VSVTVAETTWLPSATSVVFHSVDQPSPPVSSRPIGAPSIANATDETPTSSDAVAVAVVVPLTVEPATGAVIVTLGGASTGPLAHPSAAQSAAASNIAQPCVVNVVGAFAKIGKLSRQPGAGWPPANGMPAAIVKIVASAPVRATTVAEVAARAQLTRLAPVWKFTVPDRPAASG